MSTSATATGSPPDRALVGCSVVVDDGADDDLLVIYGDNGSLKADYFDSEAHVIRYLVDVRPPNAVVFVSDPNPREPRYRLTYTAAADGVLIGSFDIAAPGSPDAFKPYLSWKARKR